MQLLTVKNAAAAIQAKEHTVYNAIKAGDLPWVDISPVGADRPRIRIRDTDLEAWVESRMSTKPKDAA